MTQQQLTVADLSNLRTLLQWVPTETLNNQWSAERDELYTKLGEVRRDLEQQKPAVVQPATEPAPLAEQIEDVAAGNDIRQVVRAFAEMLDNITSDMDAAFNEPKTCRKVTALHTLIVAELARWELCECGNDGFSVDDTGHAVCAECSVEEYDHNTNDES